MSNKKVSIILLNWNNWEETQECLKSLEKVDYPNFETIIIDNNSNEENKRQLKEFGEHIPSFSPARDLSSPFEKCPVGAQGDNFQTKTIWNSENLGFAGGNNVGIKYALQCGADYIFLLNNDAIAAPDFLTKLVEVGENNEKFGILGSRIYQYGTDEVVFDGGKVNMWLTKGEHVNFQFSNSNFQVTDYITGAAFLIKRKVIEKIGLMREEYFLYYEDVDWCLRARRSGYKCVLVPESHIWHKVSVTNKEGSASYIYYHTRNGLMFAKFNGNVAQKVAAYFIGAWILLKQAVKFVLFFSGLAFQQNSGQASPPQTKRLWAKSMAEGVRDFYLNKYGKYENRN